MSAACAGGAKICQHDTALTMTTETQEDNLFVHLHWGGGELAGHARWRGLDSVYARKSVLDILSKGFPTKVQKNSSSTPDLGPRPA